MFRPSERSRPSILWVVPANGSPGVWMPNAERADAEAGTASMAATSVMMTSRRRMVPLIAQPGPFHGPRAMHSRPYKGCPEPVVTSAQPYDSVLDQLRSRC